MSKTSSKLSSDIRSIYTGGGSESDIFAFLRSNIEKLTKSEYSLIATLEYDDVERYDYLYINSNSLVVCNPTNSIKLTDDESESQSTEVTSSKAMDGSPRPSPRKSLDTSPHKIIASKSHLTESFIDSIRSRKFTSSDIRPKNLNRRKSEHRSENDSHSENSISKSGDSFQPPQRIIKLNNILGRVIASNEVLIESAFTASDIDLLQPIKTFMGIPVICAGLTIGVICIANAEKYTLKTYEKIADLVENCSMFMMWFKERKSDVNKKNAIQRIKKNSWDGIIDIDFHGNILEINKSAEDILGCAQHEVCGTKFADLIPSKSMRRGIVKYIKTMFDNDASLGESSGIDSADAENKHKLLGDTGELYMKKADENNSKTYVTLRFIKLTPRIIMVMIRPVDEMVRDRQLAEQSNEYKNIFVANVTHELKTPLNGIIGMGVQLLKTDLTEKQRSYCNIILNSGEELSRIIGDILDLSKLEDGKMDISPRPFSIEDCISSCHRSVDFQIKEKKLEYEQFIAARVPTAIIADSDRIKQIIGNLLSNAVKFTDYGRITIRVDATIRPVDKSERGERGALGAHSAHKKDSAPRTPSDRSAHNERNERNGREERAENTENDDVYMISISIMDTGIGIKQNDMTKLFKPFSQLDQGTTKSYKGTGLGLSISQRLANLMHGNITVESDYGYGSVFTLKFEAKKHNSIIITEEFKLQTITLFRSRRAIVVDDNNTNRAVMCGILMGWGVEVTTCPTADEALMFIRSGAKFDIGIIDINMPGKDGNQLAQAIRRINLNLIMIAVSSSGGQQVNMELFDDYCEKPVSEAVMIKKMMDLLSRPGLKTTRQLTERVSKDTTILIVEDNITNQLVLSDKLQEMGYKSIKIVNDGLEAVSEVKANPKKYKLIFMDIKMPRLDGKEASIFIKNIYGWKETYATIKADSKKSGSRKSEDMTVRKKHSSSHDNVSFPTKPEPKSRSDKHKKLQPSKSLSDADIKKSNSRHSATIGRHHPLAASAPYKGSENKKYCPFICALSATSIKEEEQILLDKLIFNDYITKPIDDNELTRILNMFE